MRRGRPGKESTGTRAYGSSQPVVRASGMRPRGKPTTSALAGRGEASGLTLGPYELIELLGRGSAGYVYRARHTVIGRAVAIKVLSDDLADDASSVARFVAEARAVNMLDHSNVLDVTDIVMASEPGEVPWIVMELLEGADLAQLMSGKPMDLLESLRIVRDVCQGLDVAHQAGIVHRDVKPENVFVARIDGRDVVKLIDFGIARLPDTASAEPVTSGEIIGTPSYMSPEQTGTRPIDHRADLYAVGAVLLELLTGEPPFATDDLEVLLQQLLQEEAPRASSRVTLPKTVRDDVDWLIARCLKKEPGDRPATARAVAEEIDRIVHKLGAAERIEKLSSVPAPRRDDRKRIAYGVAGVAAVALAGALAARWVGPASVARDAAAASDEAREREPSPATPPPAAAPAEPPSSPPAVEVIDAPEAAEAAEDTKAPKAARAAAPERPVQRAGRRGARRSKERAPQRDAIPLVAAPAKTESTAADAGIRDIRPAAPRPPQLIELRPAADAR